MPDGYDSFGTRYSCLRKGVGVGLYQVRDRQNRGDDYGAADEGRADTKRKVRKVHKADSGPKCPQGLSKRTWIVLFIVLLVVVALAGAGAGIYFAVRYAREKREREKKERYRRRMMYS